MNIQDGDVKFHRIGKVQFWLTRLNRIFLIDEGRAITPSLQGQAVKFDDPHYHPSPKVAAKLLQLLKTQREIRADWPTPEEDAIAYEFS